jgi:hypothetical protein
MTNNKPEANCLIEWNANAHDENSMPMGLTVKEKMLLTSKLYLKGEVTPMDYESKAQQRTDHSKEILLAH